MGSSDIDYGPIVDLQIGFSTNVHKKHIFNAHYFLAKSRQAETIFPILSAGVISTIKLTTSNISIGFVTSKYLFQKCNETFSEQQISAFKCYEVVNQNGDLCHYYWILCEPHGQIFSKYRIYVAKYYPVDPFFGTTKPTENVELFVQTKMSKLVKRSWIQTLDLCKALDSSPPIIFDRKILENIITLIKYSHHFPLMEAIYLGLHYSNSTVGIATRVSNGFDYR